MSNQFLLVVFPFNDGVMDEGVEDAHKCVPIIPKQLYGQLAGNPEDA